MRTNRSILMAIFKKKRSLLNSLSRNQIPSLRKSNKFNSQVNKSLFRILTYFLN